MPSAPAETRQRLDRIAQHYGFPATTGAGQRIALVELRGGYIVSDMDACFNGLDPRPVITDHRVTARVDGLPLEGTNSPIDVTTAHRILADLDRTDAVLADIAKTYETHNRDWSRFMGTLEVTLDVQVAGTLASGAAIDVFFAPHSGSGLAEAIRAAVSAKATVISVSWGQSESSWIGPSHTRTVVDDIENALALARKAGITVCCASGDDGCRNASPGDPADGLARVNYPASSPNALACGGTSLSFDTGAATHETVWNTTVLGTPRASGGGMSGLFARPAWQKGLSTPKPDDVWVDPGASKGFDGRWLPDVAANADRANGYPITLAGRAFTADGTSAVCPLWAALLARISEKLGHNVGWVNERIYRAGGAAFNDITQGDNAMPGVTSAFHARPGWDACTGWGAPAGQTLLAALAGN
jgi:kumamolisin